MAALLLDECDDKFHKAESIDLRVDSRWVSIATAINEATTLLFCNASLLGLSALQDKLRKTLAVT